MANSRILTEEDKHWQDVKERAAIAALQGLLSNPALVKESGYDLALMAECRADQLVEQLKKNNYDQRRKSRRTFR